jgi:2-polyprenyl-3-methyl-5-hydroxy-6-metoxy-1,4-benzoquinol methylase
MEFNTACLLCSSSNLKILNRYKFAHLCKCSSCGFVFAQKIPSVDELEEHYKKYTRNDYLSPITIKRYNEILDSFESYRKTNKIIDVGCGVGYFLEEAKKRGWDVYGTEYTDQAIEICMKKGISMQKGIFSSNNYEKNSFDIITSFEVIEHINNPIEEISNFNKILRQGGLLYLTTPNFNSIERFILKDRYNVICYPEHLSYYTKSTLGKLMKSQGFEKKELQSTGISITRIKTSLSENDNHVYVEKNNEDDKIRSIAEEMNWARLIKKYVNFLLDITGLGNSLKGYFIKQ